MLRRREETQSFSKWGRNSVIYEIMKKGKKMGKEKGRGGRKRKGKKKREGKEQNGKEEKARQGREQEKTEGKGEKREGEEYRKVEEKKERGRRKGKGRKKRREREGEEKKAKEDGKKWTGMKKREGEKGDTNSQTLPRTVYLVGNNRFYKGFQSERAECFPSFLTTQISKCTYVGRVTPPPFIYDWGRNLVPKIQRVGTKMILCQEYIPLP